MPIIIKKVSRGTVITVASIGGLLIALLGRFLFSDFHINLNKLDSQSSKLFDKSELIKAAQADAVPDDCTDECSDSCTTDACMGDSSGSGGGDH